MTSKVTQKLKQNICPLHGKMVYRQTAYGGLYKCEYDGCTVRCWQGGTSTPADQDTCDARKQAHAAFDSWWQRTGINRNRAYRQLAEFLSLPIRKTHIGFFDCDQCKRVTEFVEKQ